MVSRRLLIAALAALSWPVASSAAEAIRLTARPVALNPADPAQTRVGRLDYRGGLELDARHKRFGGLSALHVSRDGRRLLALSDVGRWVTMRLDYDARGWLVGAGRGRLGRLKRPGGGTLRWRERDAESIALMPGGRIAVGFEGRPRIWLYRPGNHPFARAPRALRVPRELRFAAGNSGLEALTALKGGRLFALAEDLAGPPPHREAAHAGWVQSGRGWAALGYERVGLFHPTGAATLPPGDAHAGDVLVLERALFLFGGFRIRVMRVPAGEIRKGALLRPKPVATLAPPLIVDNFEGIATRPGRKGQTLVYLLSDDNFSGSQRTLLLMFALR